jgi:zinc transport system substrate-binding protein
MGHGREPSPKHLMEVIQKIKKYNVKAIFTSKQFFNPKTANIVISQTGVKIIFLDSMGETGDYLNMMKYNIDKVYEGLNL